MTNVNDSAVDLGLDMSISSQRKKNSNTGAGANANSKVDMMSFLGSDTLAELVWLPQTGLNIKFAKKEPCFTREAGPSKTRFSDTPNEDHIASLATGHGSDEVVKPSSCRGSQNQAAAVTLSQHLTSNVNDSGSESRAPLKLEPSMQCGPQKHDTEIHGSVESCRSANFSTQGKRKCSLEQPLVFGCKRIKKQVDEYTTKTDNSFMNWISNMVKGLKSHNIYDQKMSVGNETRCLVSKETGFQNVFQSLFSPETIARVENKSIGSSVLAKRCSQESPGYIDLKDKRGGSPVKQVSLYEAVSKEVPQEMFNTIRRLRLSRTDIHKWMNSQLPVSQLDGFFLRLRVAKWEDGSEGSRYYVACITGLQWETPLKDLKQPIRVKVGDAECFVESQHVSNCDFIEDELVAWWQQKTSKNRRIPDVKDMKSKLAVRKTLGRLLMETGS